MNTKIAVLVLSVAAGLVGTGIGGVVGALVKNKSEKAVGEMLTFAAGIMLGVVSFEMIPSSLSCLDATCKKFFGALLVLGCVGAGVLVTFLLNFAVDKISAKRKNTSLEYRFQSVSANSHSVEILRAKRQFNLKKAGVVTLLAIAFHNIPEGMAIGASGANNLVLGIVVALIIAVHNVPEGMAISAPLVSGGVKKSRAIALALLAGLATLVGALIGVFAGGASEIASAISISLASGAMICVSVFDLLPVGTSQAGKFDAFSFFFGLVLAMILSILV